MENPPNLAGAQELHRLIGVSRQRVYQLAKREDFPRPYGVLKQGTVWLVDDVEAWISVHRRPRTVSPVSGPPASRPPGSAR